MEDAIEILLVEDDPNDVRLTLRELEREKVKNQITVVRDGVEALDFLFCRGDYKCRLPHRPPKLVLLDLKLPKLNGLEVLKEIKGNPTTRPIPVVVLTSSGEDRDVVESYKLGVNSYIQKPVNFEEFRQTIKNLGLYWLVVNRLPPDRTFDN
jgi:two-component system, response regulator